LEGQHDCAGGRIENAQGGTIQRGLDQQSAVVFSGSNKSISSIQIEPA
jgi:hypothetical protein